jgi:uncharacterized protein
MRIHSPIYTGGLGVLLVLALLASTGTGIAAEVGEVGQQLVGSRDMLQQKGWSPYLVGVGLGILSWISFLLLDSGLGASSAYARTGAMLEQGLRRSKPVHRRYYEEKLRPLLNPGWMILIGVVIGSFLSAQLSSDFQVRLIPELWQSRFGHTGGLRIFTAFVGGAVMGVGARWAGGCTSGHGITGTLQLALSSWVAFICFFIGGVATALILYH